MSGTARIQSLSIDPYRFAGHAFTYFPKRFGYDAFSEALLEMKSGIRPDMESLFVLRALEFIVMNNLQITGIVRALGSREMFDQEDHPIHRVAQKLAEQLGVPYHHEWLNKPETQKTAKLGSRLNRRRHLEGTYTVSMPGHSDQPSRILVLDDIVTTKTTALEIHRAIKSARPNSECYFFAFAETYYQRAHSSNIAAPFVLSHRVVA